MWSIQHIKHAKQFKWIQIFYIFIVGTFVFPGLIWLGIFLLSDHQPGTGFVLNYGIEGTIIEDAIFALGIIAIVLAVFNFFYALSMAIRKFD